MIQVAKLTQTEKDELVGQLYTTDSYFNPIEDCNNDWIISLEEVDFCDNPQFLWVKNLPVIDYCKRPTLIPVF